MQVEGLTMLVHVPIKVSHKMKTFSTYTTKEVGRSVLRSMFVSGIVCKECFAACSAWVYIGWMELCNVHNELRLVFLETATPRTYLWTTGSPFLLWWCVIYHYKIT